MPANEMNDSARLPLSLIDATQVTVEDGRRWYAKLTAFPDSDTVVWFRSASVHGDYVRLLGANVNGPNQGGWPDILDVRIDGILICTEFKEARDAR